MSSPSTQAPCPPLARERGSTLGQRVTYYGAFVGWVPYLSHASVPISVQYSTVYHITHPFKFAPLSTRIIRLRLRCGWSATACAAGGSEMGLSKFKANLSCRSEKNDE